MLSKKQIESFKTRGFLKFKYPNIDLLKNLKNEFVQQIEVSLKQKLPKFYKEISVM